MFSMNYMQVELDEISKIRDFIASLNSITDGVIIVEGKKDSQALKDRKSTRLNSSH